MTAPYTGLRVLDTSTAIAGAYATKLLVDAGAQVVKVEPPGGDPLRRWTASEQELPAGEDGALFHYLAAGKRSLVLDLDADGARQRLLELCAEAELVLEDAGAGSLSRRGLSLEILQQAAPRLSLVSITPWGSTGPWRERPATEFTLQAAVGSVAFRGLPERGPVCAGGQIGEWAAGAYAAVGALAAVEGARRRGRGQHVDVSMFEVVASSLTVLHDLAGQFFEGPLPQNLETPSIEPTKDGWVGITSYTGQQWKDFCLLIGRPEISEDERFYEARERMDHLAFIREAMHAYTKQHTSEEIIELASAMRIPAAPIGDGRSVLEMDHFRERGVFVENPAGFRQPRRPYRLHGHEETGIAPAPRLGELGEESPWRGARSGGGAPDGAALPFEGLRVVDLTAFWAGPITTATLGELGADIVKIESIQRPDGMRFAGALRVPPMWERSPVYHGVNTNKRGITLDLDSDDGKRIVRRLIEDADVLVENFSARVMDHFGLDWETVHGWNPRLVMLRMPAWGLDGPWRDRVGFAANVEQASGLAWITGYPDMPLIMRGVCDPVGGMHALVGLFAALEERRHTGEGRLVECALAEPALNVAAEQVIEWTAYGQLLTRDTNRGPAAAPQGCYRCAGEAARDETQRYEPWVAIAVVSDEQWRALRRLLGEPDWAKEAALDTAAGRRAAHDRIDAAISAWSAERSAEAAEAELLAAGIPAAALVNAHFLLPNPQLAQRGFHESLEHPVMGITRYPAFPARFSAHPAPRLRRAPPTMGQHNAEILCGELGLSRSELEELREAKVIGDRPAFDIA